MKAPTDFAPLHPHPNDGNFRQDCPRCKIERAAPELFQACSKLMEADSAGLCTEYGSTLLALARRLAVIAVHKASGHPLDPVKVFEQRHPAVRPARPDPEVLHAVRTSSANRPGTRWAAYQNQDIAHPQCGHLQFLAIGRRNTLKEAPSRMPDIGKEVNWRYVFVGYVDLGTGEIVEK